MKVGEKEWCVAFIVSRRRRLRRRRWSSSLSYEQLSLSLSTRVFLQRKRRERKKAKKKEKEKDNSEKRENNKCDVPAGHQPAFYFLLLRASFALSFQKILSVG